MIAKLAVRVNNETDYCVFLYFSGHVDSIGIHVTSSKKDFNNKISGHEFYTVLGEPLEAHRQVSISEIKDVFRSLSRFLDSDVDVEKILEAA